MPDVEAQGGAYATGVLVLMSSAAIAVTISAWFRNQSSKWIFLLISLVFAYTTITNIIERPDGIKIAGVLYLRDRARVIYLEGDADDRDPYRKDRI